jgi:hypothetical protein
VTRTRRSVLATVGGAALLTGCLGGSPPSTRTDRPTADATSDRTTSDRTTTPPPATVRLEPAPVPGDDATLLVYPTDLRAWLGDAASGGEVLRVHAETSVPAPQPVLPADAFDRVRLTDAPDVAGWYETDVEGGIRYRYLAGATEEAPPDDATVTPVSELPEERRRLAAAAIDRESGDVARFYPETALGEWARTDFFGGYFGSNGAVYRGHEVQQTDAAFFSRECWYVLSTSPADGGPGPTLSLASVGETVRGPLDDLLSVRTKRESVTRDAADLPESVVRFVDDTDYLLTHSTVFDATVERERG